MAKAAKKASKTAPAPMAGAGAPSAAGSNGSTQGAAPSMKILGQYVKDLSFENPDAPRSLAGQEGQPEINISVNVNAKPLADTDFEVELHLDAKAMNGDKVVFATELLLLWLLLSLSSFLSLFCRQCRQCRARCCC